MIFLYDFLIRGPQIAHVPVLRLSTTLLLWNPSTLELLHPLSSSSILSAHSSTPPSSKTHFSETVEIEPPTSYAATKSPLSLRRFPPEIRLMIFCDCIHFQDGKTPAILVALRSDSELYYEALQLFYERNYFTLKWPIVDLCRAMSVNALKRIFLSEHRVG